MVELNECEKVVINHIEENPGVKPFEVYDHMLKNCDDCVPDDVRSALHHLIELGKIEISPLGKLNIVKKLV